MNGTPAATEQEASPETPTQRPMQPQQKVNPLPVTQQPVQPQLIAGLAGGILTYCALIVAGLMALVASDEFSNLSGSIKYAGMAGIALAMCGGAFALFSVGCSINYARRVEINKPEAKCNAARRWSIHWGNASLIAVGFASLSAGVLTYGFISYNGESIASGGTYFVELQAKTGDQQVISNAVVCYPRPNYVNRTMPKQLCVLKK